MQSPGNYEADTVAWVRCLEDSSAENIAHWLHKKLWRAGQKLMWAVVKAWRMPVQMSDIGHTCPGMSRLWSLCQNAIKTTTRDDNSPCHRTEPLAELVGCLYSSLALKSEGASYTLTCVDTASLSSTLCKSVLCHQSTHQTDNNVGTPQITESDQGTHFTGTVLRSGLRKVTSNDGSICLLVQWEWTR